MFVALLNLIDISNNIFRKHFTLTKSIDMDLDQPHTKKKDVTNDLPNNIISEQPF